MYEQIAMYRLMTATRTCRCPKRWPLPSLRPTGFSKSAPKSKSVKHSSLSMWKTKVTGSVPVQLIDLEVDTTACAQSSQLDDLRLRLNVKVLFLIVVMPDAHDQLVQLR